MTGSTSYRTEASPPPELSKRHRWSAAAVLSASLLVIVMDLTILNIAIPDMAEDLQPSATQLLWIVDSYSLVLAGMLVSVSAIGDRWGRKRMLLAGYLLFGIASALVLVADTAAHVIAIRALLGLGGAMIMPTTLSLLRSVFRDPRERATALAIWASVAGIGAAIGPLVGGALLEHFSWRSAFLVNVPLMAIALMAGLLILPESRSPRPGTWDLAAAGQSLVGMVALVWALKHFAKEQSLAAPTGWLALAVGVALLAAFVRRCLRSPEPFLDLRLFLRRPFTAGVVAALGSTLALAAAMLLIAQWLQLVDGLSPIQAGLRLVPSALAGAVASLLAPWLARRLGVRAVLAGSLAMTGVGMAWLQLTPGELSHTAVYVALVLVGAGTGALALGSAMIMSSTPEDRAGNAAAIEEVSYDFGNVLGVALLGSLAAIVYRTGLDGHPVLGRLPAELAETAGDSIGNAVGIADRAGLPDLATAASAEFTHALEVTGLVGGVFLVAIAGVVFWLTPRDLDVTEQHD
ncbi:MFS transporter [Nocardioides sp. LMS-CY]|uniref:MFS transporter n=1 Tax=Nocardioides sp. (strain LMS-CY) TaxID=2840457 RepID=UPI00207A77DA|nr:MFS transporter [Nocardioides sp. LMS-CY]